MVRIPVKTVPFKGKFVTHEWHNCCTQHESVRQKIM